MNKVKKPAQAPKKQSATDKMIEECVKRAQARKRSGQTDSEWRQQYAQSLKVEGETPQLSQTPFDGAATKKKL
ncbi:hypothetical protein [Magnetospirillum fulvum]|uniref:Uncharacterized protein n=1 Tax=Magnetospirillum fulvum TaxID=1082 RepID=A0A1H6I986_MAGFU|nr:hypothetical protein [Magnetospirillum fulvum]SEH43336.1 hypothetical protein SAMN04244559_02279 [Magnetospirillum fulvum]